MSDIGKNLPDNAFWRYFLKVVSIPRPSGHEEKVREYLAEEALKHGLIVRTDEAGNLAIDRPAAPECANAPHIILQGHMDIVPQAAPGVKFDFEHDPIEPVYENGWVTTGGRTTLGSDDGVALAGAMELLTDQTLRCARLRAVFTVSEETGLFGASHIDPEFLDADVLLNLDSGEALTIGCAGGARLEGKAVPDAETPAADWIGIELKISGFHGGHSGGDIDLPYGSANLTLRELLAAFPALRPAFMHGGTLDNALARDAVLTGAIPAANLAELKSYAETVSGRLNRELTPATDGKIAVEVRETALPQQVLTASSAAQLAQLLGQLPHGVLENTPEGDIAASCNLAIVHGEAGGEWRITLLARSLFNAKRDDVVQNIAKTFEKAGFAPRVASSYSCWSPKYDSPLLELAKQLFRTLNKVEPQVAVNRGGLETGLFFGLKPELDMLSFAPEHLDLHSPAERLNVASVERFRKFLRALVENISKTAK